MRPIGAAVEFDGSHEFFAGQIDIDYRPTRPRRHVEVYLKGAPIPVAELCAKSDQCAYEQEVRTRPHAPRLPAHGGMSCGASRSSFSRSRRAPSSL